MRDLPLVEIYIKINFTKENIGSYTSVLKYNDKIKILKNSHMIDKTPNRILIRAIIESIEKLKLPSNIVLNTNTAWGGKAILSKDGTIKISHTLNLVINKDINNFISKLFYTGEARITYKQKQYLQSLMKCSNQKLSKKDIQKVQNLNEEINKIGIDNLTLKSANKYIAIFIRFEKSYEKEKTM